MTKNKTCFIVLVSLVIGVSISVWSYYFIEYAYYHDSSYHMGVNCPEQPNEEDCLPLNDYNTSGFPLQFSKEDWVYDFGDKPFSEDTTIIIDSSFSWPLFIANSLIWAIPPFLVMYMISKNPKRNKSKH